MKFILTQILKTLQYAAKNGGEVTLSKDVVLEEPLTISNGKSMLIDLAGWTISSEKECTASYSLIVNNGTLTIKDSKENGKITFKDLGQGGGSTFGSYVIENRGLLIINGGTIEHQGTINALDQHNTNIPIQNYAGRVIVNDGKMVSKDFRSLRDFTAGGQIEINGGIFEGQVWMQGLGSGSTSLTITGGEFSPLAGYDGSSIYLTNGTNVINLSITGGKFTTKVGCANPDKDGVKGSIKGGVYGDNTNLDKLVADGYVISKDGDWYEVAKGANVSSANDLSDAINNPENDMVVVSQDIDLTTSAGLSIKNDVIVDFTNNNLIAGGETTKNQSISVNGEYDVEVRNVDITGGSIMVYYGADVLLDNVSLTYTYTQSGRNMIYAASDNDKQAIVRITSGSFKMNTQSVGGSAGSGNRYVCAHGNAIVYIEGGEFSGKPEGSTYGPFEEIAIGSYYPQIIVTGGTFNFDPTAFVADGYKAVQSGSTWTVQAE